MGRDVEENQEMMNTLISIIIPVYQAEETIERCLHSIVEQTYSNLEIILIDDGSTDKSGEICDIWAEKDCRIRVIHQKNQGVSEARNRALNICTGEYIGFVDSDDWIEPDMFQTLVLNAEKFHSEISICGYVINERTVDSFDIDVAEKILNAKEAIQFLLGQESFQGFTCNKLFSKKLIMENELCFLKDIRYGEDWIFTGNAILVSKQIVYTQKPFYHYVQKEGIVPNYPGRYSDLAKAKMYLHERIVKMQPELEKQSNFVVQQQKVYSSFQSILEMIMENRIVRTEIILLTKHILSLKKEGVVTVYMQVYCVLLRISPKLFWRIYYGVQKRKVK